MEKIKLLFFFFFLISLSVAYGQESKKYLKLKQNSKYEEGYIISNDSIKIEGLVKRNIMNEFSEYSVVKFVHLDGHKATYYPYQIKGYFLYRGCLK